MEAGSTRHIPVGWWDSLPSGTLARLRERHRRPASGGVRESSNGVYAVTARELITALEKIAVDEKRPAAQREAAAEVALTIDANRAVVEEIIWEFEK